MCSCYGSGKRKQILYLFACINIVVAANAGGAFSPFGDITTLMVWQKGVIPFLGFFSIFVPSVVNYIIPAVIMYFAIPKENPAQSTEKVTLKAWSRDYNIFISSYYNFNSNKPPKISLTNNIWNDNRTRCIKHLWFFSQKRSGPGKY